MMIKMKLNKKEFEKELETACQNEIQKQMRIESMRMNGALKDVTPVDTGAARNAWSTTKKRDTDDKLLCEYETENSVEYIEKLNEGSSSQAPARFIENTALKFGRPNGQIVEKKF